MSFKVTLINGTCEFNHKNSDLRSIVSEGARVQLDPLESQVLDYFTQNCGNLVEYEQLLVFWRSAEVTDNAVTRVISSLRKKLKNAGVESNIIKNKSKKGYIFEASIEDVAITNIHTSDNDIPANTDNIIVKQSFSIQKFYYLGIVAVLLFVTLLAENSDSADLMITDINTSTVLRSLGSKVELAVNPENQKIAFSMQAARTDDFNVQIYDVYTNELLTIREDGKNIRKTTWLNENEFMARVYDNDTCEIKKFTVNYTYQTYTSASTFLCNANSRAFAIAKLNDDQVIISEAQLNNTASTLYKGDINSGFSEPLNVRNGGGMGFYNIVSAENSRLVVLLSTSDTNQFNIVLVDPTNKWRAVWKYKTAAINLSVGWDGTYLSFKNANNGITIVTFDDVIEKSRVDIPMFLPFNNITSTSNGIMLTTGEFYPQDLVLTRDDTPDDNNLTKGTSASNQQPIILNDEKVVYVSNASGMDQLWLRDVNLQKARQVSNFQNIQLIKKFTVSQEINMVAIQTNLGIDLYSVTEPFELNEPFYSFEGYNPVFFENTLLYTEYDGSFSNIKQLELDSLTISDFVIEDGLYAQVLNDTILYNKSYIPDIWQRSAGGTDELLLSLPFDTSKWYTDDQYIYYSTRSGAEFKYDFVTNELESVSLNACQGALTKSGNFCVVGKEVVPEMGIVSLEW